MVTREELERVFGSLGQVAKIVGLERTAPYRWFRDRTEADVSEPYMRLLRMEALIRGQILRETPRADRSAAA